MVKQLWYVAFLVIILVGISPTVGQDLDPNLVAWWTFDGDATDLSGNGHNGTLVGAAGFADEGMVGGSLALYNNGYVNIDGWPGAATVATPSLAGDPTVSAPALVFGSTPGAFARSITPATCRATP